MVRKSFLRVFAAAAVAALCLLNSAAALADLPGAGKTIKPARATWNNEWVGTEIYIKALQKLGYNVERPVTLENPTFYQAVGQGDVDFWVNGWFPLHNTYTKAFGNNAEVIGYMVKGGALQGYMIDKKTADAAHIKSLEDFKRPEVAKLFDTTGDGKASLVACPPGWGCELVQEEQLDAYGLRATVEPIKAAYDASMAQALGLFKEGKPIFFYAATPGWVTGVLKPGVDVVWLQVPFPSLPKGQEANLTKVSVPGVKGCASNPCMMGYPPNDIRVVANKKFLNDNPAVRKLFELVSIPLAEFSAQNAKMFQGGEGKDQDIVRHAQEWIDANQATFDSWIDQAKKAAGKP